jgi:hypothetical protein
VPADVHAELLGSPSLGSYFNENIRDAYSYRPVSAPRRRA